MIPVVDLRLRFEMEGNPQSEHTRIVVVNASQMTVGLIVDAVEQVLRINQSQIEPPHSGVFAVQDSCIGGVVKLDQSTLSLLDVDKLLTRLDVAGEPHIGGTG